MPKQQLGIAEILKKLNEYDLISNDHAIFFRGHSNKSYKLEPYIYRNDIIKNEHIIFKELLLRCPQDFEHCKTTFEFLVKMQHYSLPTRLLDITTNPLIALYFACQSKSKNDAELIIFKVPKSSIKYYDSDTVSILSNLSRIPCNFQIPKSIDTSLFFLDDGFDEMCEEFNTQQSIKKLVYEIQSEKPHFEPRIEPDVLSSVLCVKPRMDNQRVIRQDSAFFLFGIDNFKKDKPAKLSDSLILTKDKKIIIPHSDKARIIGQLEILGITEATIFPEIEKVATYIKRIYSK
ncbi:MULTISPECIES: FRG domain-containing protein [Acinetobacter]|uniref:FRG domain-containing protein n=1 Tax=Acinetobacter TaxID=469 RepID=UPI001588D487|nr:MULTISPECIES: FRG domain-containing protein [Acinetobacter]QKW82758.1 FRG domain-containing protein [Acinetobacter sp. FDAARGOS_724]